MPTLKPILVNVHDLGSSGEGIGYFEGSTIFIRNALPGEWVEAAIINKRKSIVQASVKKITKSSKDRVEPSCPHFNRCGGCQLMHLAYDAQLQAKQKRVKNALIRIGKIENPDVQPCLPSPSPFAYRNKIQLPIRKKENQTVIGLYAHSSHELIEIQSCQIHCPLGEKVFQRVKEIIVRSKIEPFDPSTGKGELRHLLIKTAIETKQVLIILVTTSYSHIGLEQIAEDIIKNCPDVKGVVQNVNDSSGNVILGKIYHLLRGSKSITENICGLTFKVSPASFFQVNHAQAQHLYEKVIALAELTGKEIVLDAYCGVGTLSLLLAKHAKQVIGIEVVPEAIENARDNAVENGIFNVHFECTLSEDYIHKLNEIDMVILNPPRKGCEKSFLEGIKRLRPKTLIYISCDPATLARDLAFLISTGYNIDFVQPYDMFPQTSHVETVVKLSSRK